MDPRFQYILDYFRKIYPVPHEIEIGYGTHDQKINIRKGGIHYFNTLDAYSPKQVIWKMWQNQNIPMLFDENDTYPVLTVENSQVFIHYDILASAFFFLSGWQEYVHSQRKSTDRFPYNESLQFQLKIAQLPVVHYYFDILKTAIETMYNVSLDRPIWGDHGFALCLTHDIDKCQSGWLEDSLDALKKGHLFLPVKFLFNRIFREDQWFNFNEICDLEKDYSAHSSFYFLPSRRMRIFGDGDYRISHKKIRGIIAKLNESDFEVGFHGRFGTHQNLQDLSDDLNLFPSGVQIKGGRFHFLHFDITKTFDILECTKCGYDSTLGFSEETGFRNGIALPFYPYNFIENRPYRVLEIPLHVMDATLRRKKQLSHEDIVTEVEKIMTEVGKWGGCLTLLWHNNYFSEYKFAGWKSIYQNILQKAKLKNALLLSGAEVYDRFQSILKSDRGENS